jgi:hypothetical protein
LTPPPGALLANKSPLVRIIEIACSLTFTSPRAIKRLNLSALGFLAALAFLGLVPLPGWHGWSDGLRPVLLLLAPLAAMMVVLLIGAKNAAAVRKA